MKNFKKQLENQKKINEAVKALAIHFVDYQSYAEHYCGMAKAQTEILQLMELNSLQLARGESGVATEDITDFLYDVSLIYELLKPFADMIGQVYGNEE